MFSMFTRRNWAQRMESSSTGGIRTHDQLVTRNLSVSEKRGLYYHPRQKLL